MEKVAEHINEMQRIHEEYGAIFDHLFRQHQKSCKQYSLIWQAIDLSPGDLLYYGGVEWLNISDFLGKIKKGLELHAMCFVFKTAVVFLCKERLRQKKKLMGGSGKNSSSEVEIIRYQVLIPVTEVQVRASSMKDMDNHFLWELIHLKSQVQRRSEKVYHLSNSTSEFRNAFLKTIRQIIRESVRNMNIPPNKPPSSGSSGTGGSSGGGMGGGPGSGRMNTSTLQPSKSSGGKKKHPQTQTGSLQRHSGAKYDDYDSVESYDNVPETQPQNYHQSKDHHQESSQEEEIHHHQQPQQKQQPQYYQHTPQQQHHKQLISQLQNHQKKQAQQHQPKDLSLPQQFSPEQQPQQINQQTTKNKTQQHPLQQQSSSGSYDSDQQQGSLRTRSKTMSDAMDELSDSTTKSDGGREDYGTRSEGEEESSERKPVSLGRTPNHLSLSTTSTLSTGSTGSQARLIQASNQPSNYQPVKSLGSPIWKPRENFGSTQSGKSALGSSSTSLSSRCGKSRNGRGSLPGGNNNAPGGLKNFVVLLSYFVPSQYKQLWAYNNSEPFLYLNFPKNFQAENRFYTYSIFLKHFSLFGMENLIPEKRERVYLPKTNPPPFSYIGSSFRMPFATSSLPKSHSSLDLQKEDDDSSVTYNCNNSTFNKSTVQNSFNRSAIFEEESSYNSSEICLAKKEFGKQCKLPGICTVTTYSKKDLVKNIKFSSSNIGVLRRNSSSLNDRELAYSKSKSLEPFSRIQNIFSNNPEFARGKFYSSHREASSNASSPVPYQSPTGNSTFIKQGTSFKLIENSLIKSDSSLDLSSLDENKSILTRTHRNIEETFNKLSSGLIVKEHPNSHCKIRVMDKTSYLDHILHKLEEIKEQNITEEKRNSSISAINRNSSIYEFTPPPKPPTRSSSYIEKSYSNSQLNVNFSDIELSMPSKISETRHSAKRYSDFQSIIPRVRAKNNDDYDASIEVLNKTAQTIDSLVSQLQNF
ncbi:Protein still life, isoforms C/SIF type 2 [Armadillidium vulgare]|nr:Protein still life, isoforms C/SIF type 2 [Armadillidium vulgare]